jgi:hypothetical protein
MGGEISREIKSLRNEVHNANAVVWGPVCTYERAFVVPCDAGNPAKPHRFIGPWNPFPIVLPWISTY